jgi:hypothetical protein
MKKLEKINSKLFEAFKMDEVSSLASVVGGAVYTKTADQGGCEDTWKSVNYNDRGNPSDRSAEIDDLCRSQLSEDRGTYAAFFEGNLDGPLEQGDISDPHLVFNETGNFVTLLPL